jgi:Rieske 2Fe-2S family protein
VVASGKDVAASVELFHRVNQQDFDACERCLVPSEHHIGEFHEWVQDKIAGIGYTSAV